MSDEEGCGCPFPTLSAQGKPFHWGGCGLQVGNFYTARTYVYFLNGLKFSEAMERAKADWQEYLQTTPDADPCQIKTLREWGVVV